MIEKEEDDLNILKFGSLCVTYSCRLVLEYFCSRPTQPYIDCSIAIGWLVSNVFSKLFHRRTQSQIVYICLFSPQCFFLQMRPRIGSLQVCALPMGTDQVPIRTAKHWWEVGLLRLRPSVSVSLLCSECGAAACGGRACMGPRLAAEHWWARCRAPLPPAVSQLGTSWYQDNPSIHFQPPQG